MKSEVYSFGTVMDNMRAAAAFKVFGNRIAERALHICGRVIAADIPVYLSEQAALLGLQAC